MLKLSIIPFKLDLGFHERFLTIFGKNALAKNTTLLLQDIRYGIIIVNN